MNQITPSNIQAHKASGSWKALEALAADLVHSAAGAARSELVPVLGGGTRLMLALEHRISHDIDLFIRDPQWIGYLSPRLNDTLDGKINAYEEGAVSLKLKFNEGEIDFIVAMSLLGLEPQLSKDSVFLLEPIAEVLAKKLFYRGWALTPRDLFDWWAIETFTPHEIPHTALAQLMQTKWEGVLLALDQLAQSHTALNQWHSIQTHHSVDLPNAIAWASNKIRSYQKQ